MILEAIDTIAPVEREVRDKSGRWFSLRIRPYKNVDNKIDGAVLTLFDVDVTKRSEQRMRLAKDYTDALMRVIDQPLVVLDRDMRVQTASEYFARALGKTTLVRSSASISPSSMAHGVLRSFRNVSRSSAPTSSPFERVPIAVDRRGFVATNSVGDRALAAVARITRVHRCWCWPFQRRSRPRRLVERK